MNIFTFIKSRVSIVDVINEYATLKKAGGYWKARCPFHHEKTGSFTVSPHKEIFYCFGCHKSGDVISFIADIEHCSQIEAAKHLAERYQIELPEDLQSSHSAQDKNHYHDVCNEVAEWCHEQLKKNPSVLQYLKERDISDQSISYFKIGYFPSGLLAIKNLINHMKNQNILVDDLLEAAILAQGKTVLYSPFEDRIMFPIADTMGNYCGFGGRIFKPNDTRPKYYNSHENEFFSKGSLLFGLDMAKRKIQDSGDVFLVEGYTDCVAMAQYGYQNTVATLGTACTLPHLKLLARYANNVYVLYDGDAAGKQAILRLTQLCWQANTELKVIELPPDEDPASFLTKGNDLKELIANAQDIFGFFIHSMGTGFQSKPLAERVSQTRKLLEIIAGVDDSLKVDLLLQQASSTLGLPVTSLTRELERARNQTQKHSNDYDSSVRTPSQAHLDHTRDRQGERTEKTSLNPENSSARPEDLRAYEREEYLPSNQVNILEKKIFCAIINNTEFLNSTNEKYLTSYMPSPLREILVQLIEFRSENQSVAFVPFFDTLSDTHKQYVSRLLVEFEGQITPELFETLLLSLQKQQWKMVTQSIKDQLNQAKHDGDETKIAQILHDYLELKKKILPQVSRS